MTKVFMVLWLLVDGQSTSPPDRYEMQSLEACLETISEKLASAEKATEDSGTQYLAACVVDKQRPS